MPALQLHSPQVLHLCRTAPGPWHGATRVASRRARCGAHRARIETRQQRAMLDQEDMADTLPANRNQRCRCRSGPEHTSSNTAADAKPQVDRDGARGRHETCRGDTQGMPWALDAVRATQRQQSGRAGNEKRTLFSPHRPAAPEGRYCRNSARNHWCGNGPQSKPHPTPSLLKCPMRR